MINFRTDRSVPGALYDVLGRAVCDATCGVIPGTVGEAGVIPVLKDFLFGRELEM